MKESNKSNVKPDVQKGYANNIDRHGYNQSNSVRNDQARGYGSGTYNCGSRRGFTLAEVLITLAIIGIIAAMTIPSIVANPHRPVQRQCVCTD